jgi:hypothetical protein
MLEIPILLSIDDESVAWILPKRTRSRKVFPLETKDCILTFWKNLVVKLSVWERRKMTLHLVYANGVRHF